MKFMGRNRPFNIITCGFSQSNDCRQYMIYDTRNMEKPLVLNKLDQSSNVPILHYDDDLNMLHVIDKGTRCWHQYYYMDLDGTPSLSKIVTNNDKENTHGFYFYPKRDVDTTKHEFLKAWRLTSK